VRCTELDEMCLFCKREKHVTAEHTRMEVNPSLAEGNISELELCAFKCIHWPTLSRSVHFYLQQ